MNKPYVISVLNYKGGVGKTNTTRNLGRALSLENYRVLLVDADPQCTLENWSQQNGGTLIPVMRKAVPTLDVELKCYTEWDFKIIDCPPALDHITKAAIKAADLVIIPVQPSPDDIRGTHIISGLLQEHQLFFDGRPQTIFLINRAKKNTKLTKELPEDLASLSFPTFKTIITELVVYPTTAIDGLTVFEANSPQAKSEFASLAKEVLDILGRQ